MPKAGGRADGFGAGPVRVRVPASSANLGPGFDSLGLALCVYDTVDLQVGDSGLSVEISGEGADRIPRDRRNLVVRAARATFDVLGGQPAGLVIACANRIPQGCGLGSSAAAIVAGITAARAVAARQLSDQKALRLATALEGHADNVAACLLGGATLAWTAADGCARAVRLPTTATLHPVAFLPTARRQSTHASRAALPATVPHADATYTAAHSALLVHALGSRPDLLLEATDDRLHQPYRLAFQRAGGELIGRLRTAGIAAVLSGSGPTVLALATSAEQASAAVALASPDTVATRLELDQIGVRVSTAGGRQQR